MKEVKVGQTWSAGRYVLLVLDVWEPPLTTYSITCLVLAGDSDEVGSMTFFSIRGHNGNVSFGKIIQDDGVLLSGS